MLRLPDDPTNPLKLADWLELMALLAPDGNASRGDLERSLQRATLYELRDDQAIELKTLDVFDELEQRLKAAEAAYPFAIDYGTLQLKSAWRQFPAYIFCLCLSYFGARNSEPRKLFEIISSVAAKAFLYGDAIDFGFPRRTLPSSFAEAVSELCRLIGEGGRSTQLPTLGQKDAKLDLVAWS